MNSASSDDKEEVSPIITSPPPPLGDDPTPPEHPPQLNFVEQAADGTTAGTGDSGRASTTVARWADDEDEEYEEYAVGVQDADSTSGRDGDDAASRFDYESYSDSDSECYDEGAATSHSTPVLSSPYGGDLADEEYSEISASIATGSSSDFSLNSPRDVAFQALTTYEQYREYLKSDAHLRRFTLYMRNPKSKARVFNPDYRKDYQTFHTNMRNSNHASYNPVYARAAKDLKDQRDALKTFRSAPGASASSLSWSPANFLKKPGTPPQCARPQSASFLTDFINALMAESTPPLNEALDVKVVIRFFKATRLSHAVLAGDKIPERMKEYLAARRDSLAKGYHVEQKRPHLVMHLTDSGRNFTPEPAAKAVPLTYLAREPSESKNVLGAFEFLDIVAGYDDAVPVGKLASQFYSRIGVKKNEGGKELYERARDYHTRKGNCAISYDQDATAYVQLEKTGDDWYRAKSHDGNRRRGPCRYDDDGGGTFGGGGTMGSRPSTHFSHNCFVCRRVGFDTAAELADHLDSPGHEAEAAKISSAPPTFDLMDRLFKQVVASNRVAEERIEREVKQVREDFKCSLVQPATRYSEEALRAVLNSPDLRTALTSNPDMVITLRSLLSHVDAAPISTVKGEPLDSDSNPMPPAPQDSSPSVSHVTWPYKSASLGGGGNRGNSELRELRFSATLQKAFDDSFYRFATVTNIKVATWGAKRGKAGRRETLWTFENGKHKFDGDPNHPSLLSDVDALPNESVYLDEAACAGLWNGAVQLYDNREDRYDHVKKEGDVNHFVQLISGDNPVPYGAVITGLLRHKEGHHANKYYATSVVVPCYEFTAVATYITAGSPAGKYRVLRAENMGGTILDGAEIQLNESLAYVEEGERISGFAALYQPSIEVKNKNMFVVVGLTGYDAGGSVSSSAAASAPSSLPSTPKLGREVSHATFSGVAALASSADYLSVAGESVKDKVIDLTDKMRTTNEGAEGGGGKHSLDESKLTSLLDAFLRLQFDISVERLRALLQRAEKDSDNADEGGELEIVTRAARNDEVISDFFFFPDVRHIEGYWSAASVMAALKDSSSYRQSKGDVTDPVWSIKLRSSRMGSGRTQHVSKTTMEENPKWETLNIGRLLLDFMRSCKTEIGYVIRMLENIRENGRNGLPGIKALHELLSLHGDDVIVTCSLHKTADDRDYRYTLMGGLKTHYNAPGMYKKELMPQIHLYCTKANGQGTGIEMPGVKGLVVPAQAQVMVEYKKKQEKMLLESAHIKARCNIDINEVVTMLSNLGEYGRSKLPGISALYELLGRHADEVEVIEDLHNTGPAADNRYKMTLEGGLKKKMPTPEHGEQEGPLKIHLHCAKAEERGTGIAMSRVSFKVSPVKAEVYVVSLNKAFVLELSHIREE